jgi:hypothetical protein
MKGLRNPAQAAESADSGAAAAAAWVVDTSAMAAELEASQQTITVRCCSLPPSSPLSNHAHGPPHCRQALIQSFWGVSDSLHHQFLHTTLQASFDAELTKCKAAVVVRGAVSAAGAGAVMSAGESAVMSGDESGGAADSADSAGGNAVLGRGAAGGSAGVDPSANTPAAADVFLTDINTDS